METPRNVNTKILDVERKPTSEREYKDKANIDKADNISMLFIDGDHREKSVYKDLVKFAPWLRREAY